MSFFVYPDAVAILARGIPASNAYVETMIVPRLERAAKIAKERERSKKRQKNSGRRSIFIDDEAETSRGAQGDEEARSGDSEGDLGEDGIDMGSEGEEGDAEGGHGDGGSEGGTSEDEVTDEEEVVGEEDASDISSDSFFVSDGEDLVYESAGSPGNLPPDHPEADEDIIMRRADARAKGKSGAGVSGGLRLKDSVRTFMEYMDAIGESAGQAAGDATRQTHEADVVFSAVDRRPRDTGGPKKTKGSKKPQAGGSVKAAEGDLWGYAALPVNPKPAVACQPSREDIGRIFGRHFSGPSVLDEGQLAETLAYWTSDGEDPEAADVTPKISLTRIPLHILEHLTENKYSLALNQRGKYVKVGLMHSDMGDDWTVSLYLALAEVYSHVYGVSATWLQQNPTKHNIHFGVNRDILEQQFHLCIAFCTEERDPKEHEQYVKTDDAYRVYFRFLCLFFKDARATMSTDHQTRRIRRIINNAVLEYAVPDAWLPSPGVLSHLHATVAEFKDFTGPSGAALLRVFVSDEANAALFASYAIASGAARHAATTNPRNITNANRAQETLKLDTLRIKLGAQVMRFLSEKRVAVDG
jgi:hypothetical protein